MKRVYNVYCESGYEEVRIPADAVDLKVKTEDYLTKITLTGTKEQFAEFDKIRELPLDQIRTIHRA